MIGSKCTSSVTLVLIFLVFILEESLNYAFTISHSLSSKPSLSYCNTNDNINNGEGRKSRLLSMKDVDTTTAMSTIASKQEKEETMSVSSHMKFIGPYACLSLRFPNLATQSQKDRNVTGISLDFVLDTAANTNTLNAQVAQELGLEVVGKALPGIGAAGGIGGGDTFSLGDCHLDEWISSEDDKEEENPAFMTGLTASALPVASPAAAGLLGCYFFHAFEGGVEFDWGSSSVMNAASDSNGDSKSVISSSITFHGEELNQEQREERGYMTGQPIPITILKDTNLPSIMLTINGVQIPALLDTGSPITVLNSAAAKIAGVEATLEEKKKNDGFKNPFAKLVNNFQTAQAMAQREMVSLAGTDGRRIDLIRSKSEQSIYLSSTTSFHPQKIYVGDIPGLEALDGLRKDDHTNGDVKPAAILGMDILRSKRKMLYRQNELYFSDEL
mmetsp:Transcript_14264/g.13774  ORF Transcript_14264/g.13774 Transcript_14264/m.13774 type:complete len:444 (-) Transcript_14264:68-1399(-)